MPESEKYDVLFELQVKKAQFQTALQRALNVTWRPWWLPTARGPAHGSLYDDA
jgi:hypothetical protein